MSPDNKRGNVEKSSRMNGGWKIKHSTLEQIAILRAAATTTPIKKKTTTISVIGSVTESESGKIKCIEYVCEWNDSSRDIEMKCVLMNWSERLHLKSTFMICHGCYCTLELFVIAKLNSRYFVFIFIFQLENTHTHTALAYPHTNFRTVAVLWYLG